MQRFQKTLSRRDMALGMLAGALAPATAQADIASFLSDEIEGFDKIGPAVDAYIYGYPLVMMELTRRVSTNVSTPDGMRAPIGQLARMRTYPDASYRLVTAPNADTLYTTAWVDVAREPYVLSIPDMKDRYFMFPMLDAWTNVFFSPGTRTTGAGAQEYAITGPDWRGVLPPGVVQVKTPTALVWIVGRIYCNGAPKDYAEVHRLQDACKLTPLSAYGTAWTPPQGRVDPALDIQTPVRKQLAALNAADFFTILADLLATNPPAAADTPMLPQLAQLGVVPGKQFDRGAFDLDFARLLPKAAAARLLAYTKFGDALRSAGGWEYTLKTGTYGTDYLQRALIAAIGLGANLPQDAVYPISKKDGSGGAYSGTKRYVLRFPNGAMPPVRAFWSLTMYDEEGFFVVNPLNRYTISPRQNLRSNPDGSVDLLIQHESPGAANESNWLPAPAGTFSLMLRLYWPTESPPSLLDGAWLPPPVKQQG